MLIGLNNEKELFNGYSIAENNDSLIAVAKTNIILPEKKRIILASEANESEKAIINSITKGGLVL